MTELQQTELELLKLFVDICGKYDLRYYMVCGSALGAVKYKGFIPWDDDIDVGLPRDDYEKFLALAPKELPQWCFLQNYRTDPRFPHVYSKLRNSNTTFIEAGSAHLPINHGIYIDVFPLDGYPKENREQERLNRRKKVLARRQYCALKDEGDWKVRLRNPVFRFLGYHKRTAKTMGELEYLISQYPVEKSDVWCNHGNWQGRLEYAPRWQYGNGVKAVFEGLEVIVPEQYDAYLTQKYGDWRAELPKEQQRSHHGCLVCDVNRPYLEYFAEGKVKKL